MPATVVCTLYCTASATTGFGSSVSAGGICALGCERLLLLTDFLRLLPPRELEGVRFRLDPDDDPPDADDRLLAADCGFPAGGTVSGSSKLMVLSRLPAAGTTVPVEGDSAGVSRGVFAALVAGVSAFWLSAGVPGSLLCMTCNRCVARGR